MAGQIWTQEELQKLEKLYNTGTPVRETVKFFPNRTRYAVYIKANLMGLKTDYIERKYSYKKDFWSTYTKENCYLGGFAAADACIMQRKDGGYSFATEIKEDYHLEKMKNCYAPEYPVSYNKRDNTFKVSCNVCNQWVDDLRENFNIVPRKTYSLKFPWQIPNNLLPYWLCGFIDGDGCFHKAKNREAFSLSFIAASRDVLDGINTFISQYYGSVRDRGREVRKVPERSLYRFHISGVAACNLYLDLRRYIPELHLARKWDRPDYVKFCEEYSKKFPVKRKEFLSS